MVRTALGLLIILFFVQWAIGHWSGSLALQADAGHILSDILALGVTFGAIALAKRPTDDRATFGHQRLEILAALLNGLSLLGISGWIIYESLWRWQSPPDVLSLPMLLGSLLGLTINGFNLWVLSQESQRSLNLKAAFLHTASDLVSSIGAVVAGISIHLWHCVWIDTCIALVVAGLTMVSALPLLRESLEVFLEYAPKSLDLAALRAVVVANPGVEKIESLRVWSLTQETTALCLKLQVTGDLAHRDRLLQMLQTQLTQDFHIHEVTIQISNIQSNVHPMFQQSLLKSVLGHP